MAIKQISLLACCYMNVNIGPNHTTKYTGHYNQSVPPRRNQLDCRDFITLTDVKAMMQVVSVKAILQRDELCNSVQIEPWTTNAMMFNRDNYIQPPS